MQINYISGQNFGVSNQKDNKAMDKTTFKSHKLVGNIPLPHYPDIKASCYVLGNGLKAFIVPLPVPTVGVTAVVKTGALNETEAQRGISHFREHLGFDGSTGLRPGEYIKKLEKSGVYLNAYTNHAVTAFTAVTAGAPQKAIKDVVTDMARMIKYPRFPKGQYKKEQEVVIKEINQYKNEVEALQAERTIKNLFGIDTESSDLVLGQEENIRALSRKDMISHQKANYAPNRMEVFVVGDVKPETAIKWVDKAYDTPDFQPSVQPQKYSDIHPISQTKIEYLSSDKVEASSVMVGFLGPKNADSKGTIAADALMCILGLDKSSRVNRKLSKIDAEATIAIDSVSNHPEHPQVMSFTIPMTPGEEQIALDSLRKGIKGLKAKPVTEEDLQAAKRSLLYMFKQKNSSSGRIMKALTAPVSTGGVDSYSRYIQDINSLTVADVNNAARYLDTKKAAVTVVQPAKKVNKNLTFSGRKIIDPKNVSKKVLPNNLSLVSLDNPLSLFPVGVIELVSPVKVKSGVRDILAKMLETSCTKYSEIELAQKQGEKNLEVHVMAQDNGIGASIMAEDEHFVDGLDLAKELLFAPAITRRNFEKAKHSVSIELQSVSLEAEDRAYEEMYGNHVCGESDRKLKNAVRRVTFKDVKKYYDDLMTTSSARAVINGQINQGTELASKVEHSLSNFGDGFLPQVEISEPIKTPKIPIVVTQAKKDEVQSDICQLYHVPVTDIKDTAALSVMNEILGGSFSSRLFTDLREKQNLAYEAYSEFSPSPDASQFCMRIKTDINTNGDSNDNIEKSMQGFAHHLDRMKHQYVRRNELESAKKLVRSAIILRLQKPEVLITDVLEKLDTKQGVGYFDRVLAEVAKVSPADIKRVAQKYLSTPPVTSILTTKEGLEKARPFLETQGRIKSC